MNHQIFEEWLFADPTEEPLTPQQARLLEEHLRACDPCRSLAAALREMDGQLHAATFVEPEPGFGNRWQVHLEADRRRLHRRQSLALLGFSVAGAALLFSSLALLLWPALRQPEVMLYAGLYRVSSLIASFTEQSSFLSSLLVNLGLVPILWWVLAAGFVSELAVIWIVSLRVLTRPRRVLHEVEQS